LNITREKNRSSGSPRRGGKFYGGGAPDGR